MSIRPGARLIQALLGWAALGALPLLARFWAVPLAAPLLLGWALLGGLLAVWALDDLLRLRRRPTPAASRRLPAALSVGVPQTVTLTLDTGGVNERWLVADHHPDDDIHTGLPRTLDLVPGHRQVEIHYPYRPSRRGTVRFGPIELWLPSPRRLWESRRRIAADRAVPVYPDFSPISRAALAVDRSRSRFGNRVQPRQGEGLEFHELRDYQPGDSPRRIDWKATARRRRLITRHYQDEQNQTVWVLLDGGRRMALPIGGLTAFDHGLNAALLLAWSALRQGDRTGALLFSGEQPRWLDPVHGQHGIQSLLRGFHDVQPADRASDFSQAARQFQGRWTRRALVVIISRVQPEDADDLLTAVRLLGHRHLVMVADMELPEQAALRQTPVTDLDDALRVAADAREHEQRRDLHLRLRHAGAHLVAATPATLAERLGQAYQQLKRAGRL
ncbi:MAG: DUF58 domain-containing protein [Alcanivorax sp.]|nr:DUF58 domain-containing protein [Alcanivorax sp.]